MGSSTPINTVPLAHTLLRTVQIIHDDEQTLWLVQRDGAVLRLEADLEAEGYWIGEMEFGKC